MFLPMPLLTMVEAVKVPRANNAAQNFYKPAPAEIQYGKLRFLITDRPTDSTVGQFIEELNKHDAKSVVRVCEPTYQVEPLEQVGIRVYDWEFNDGSFPPQSVLSEWLKLVRTNAKSAPGSCIAVHCVAGLGRAPVLVALALMEAGMKFEEAVEVIRQHRRGAINQRQLESLGRYKATGLLKNGRKECCVM